MSLQTITQHNASRWMHKEIRCIICDMKKAEEKNITHVVIEGNTLKRKS